jgi:hypothetical protein
MTLRTCPIVDGNLHRARIVVKRLPLWRLASNEDDVGLAVCGGHV